MTILPFPNSLVIKQRLLMTLRKREPDFPRDDKKKKSSDFPFGVVGVLFFPMVMTLYFYNSIYPLKQRDKVEPLFKCLRDSNSLFKIIASASLLSTGSHCGRRCNEAGYGGFAFKHTSNGKWVIIPRNARFQPGWSLAKKRLEMVPDGREGTHPEQRRRRDTDLLGQWR